MLEFTLCVMHIMCLNKGIMTGIYHYYSIIQTSFIALKICGPPINPSLPPLNPWQPLMILLPP